MDVFECIFSLKRYTKFSEREIDDRIIGVILEAATHAPSAGNLQEWEFIVVKDKEMKSKIAEAALHQKFLEDAPVLIVVCADLEKAKLKYEERGERLYSIQDTAYATMLLIVASRALGLGSCLVQAMDEEEMRRILALPTYKRPMCIVAIGYPAEEPEVPPHIPFENLSWLNVHGERFEIESKTIVDYIKKVLSKMRKKKKEELLV